MAVVVPYVPNPTWADGSGGGTPISAAKLNLFEDGIKNVSQGPAVRVTHNTTQSLTTAVETALAFNTERFDQAGGLASTQHDVTTNNSRLTCLYAGIYQITGHVEFASNATGYRSLRIRLNAATYIGSGSIVAAISGAVMWLTATTTYSLAVNDYVELMATQTSGGGLNVNNTGNYSPEFSMVRVA